MLFWNLLLSLSSMNEAYVHYKLLYLKTFTKYISKTQILGAVILESLVLNQQHQYHIELVRSSSQTWGSLVTQMVEFACSAGDLGLIAGLGRSPGKGNDNPLQYSCLKNSNDRGVWRLQCMGSHRVEHNWATHTHTHTYTHTHTHLLFTFILLEIKWYNHPVELRKYYSMTQMLTIYLETNFSSA